jgi:hypothetical protein
LFFICENYLLIICVSLREGVGGYEGKLLFCKLLGEEATKEATAALEFATAMSRI